jgi:bifunctional non-homologous end joining protein LigD
MLATLASEVPLDPEWAYEMKWDGVRALTAVHGGAVRITSRAGRDITAGYPELHDLADELGDASVLLDGEIVALNERGRPDFQLLQRRMHVRDEATLRSLRREVPIALMIFDLLWFDGRQITDLAYTERRRVLDALGPSGTTWQVPPAGTEDGEAAMATSLELGLEGIVAKRLDSVYEPGRRSLSWRKVKHDLRQEFVVAGWTPGKGRREGRVGALLLGYFDHDGELNYAGKVGTGFTGAELERLDVLLVPIARETSPFTGTGVPRDAHFVVPRYVAEVRFAEWTEAGRIRQPAYLGLRDDKSARAVVREA